MKKLCLALFLVVACKSSSSTSSQPSTQGPPPMTEPAPAEPTPTPAEPTPPAPSPPPDTTQTKPTPPPSTPANPPTTTALPKMGETCGPGDVCEKGLTCVKYLGIAGARGPEFKSCEVKCNQKQACPAGTNCVTIADGPGQVCRAPMNRP